MSDYIDRDLLLAEIEELKKSPWYNDCGENYERIIRSDAIGTVVDLCVKSAPVADVQEVKHGEHPKKTYTQDFFEKFPKAQSYSDGSPVICRQIIYGGIRPPLEICYYTGACYRCWNEPLNDEETKGA